MKTIVRMMAIAFACLALTQCASLEERRMERFKADAALKKERAAAARAAEEKRMRDEGYFFVPNHAPARVYREIYDGLTPGKARVRISLSDQRAFLMNGDQVALETPVSTGKSTNRTPRGSFTITERDLDHRSNIYGDYVDSDGDVVKANVSVRKDKRPAGSKFLGAPMSHFMRLTNAGVGMHIGYLPGYAASHGCIRLPREIGPMIWEKTKMGTPVKIVP